MKMNTIRILQSCGEISEVKETEGIQQRQFLTKGLEKQMLSLSEIDTGLAKDADKQGVHFPTVQ